MGIRDRSTTLHTAAPGAATGSVREPPSVTAGASSQQSELTSPGGDHAPEFFLAGAHGEEGANEKIDGYRWVSGFHFCNPGLARSNESGQLDLGESTLRAPLQEPAAQR